MYSICNKIANFYYKITQAKGFDENHKKISSCYRFKGISSKYTTLLMSYDKPSHVSLETNKQFFRNPIEFFKNFWDSIGVS